MKYDIFNNKDERSLANSLGVSIAHDGSLFYFGDININGHTHGETFKDEVEKKQEFKNLNIQLDSNEEFFIKLMKCTVQGILTICNLSTKSQDNSIKSAMIFSPDNLSEKQIEVMEKLYAEFLSKTSDIQIAVFDNNGNHNYCKITDYVENYLNKQEIQIKK